VRVGSGFAGVGKLLTTTTPSYKNTTRKEATTVRKILVYVNRGDDSEYLIRFLKSWWER
jgi:hypothetical protein